MTVTLLLGAVPVPAPRPKTGSPEFPFLWASLPLIALLLVGALVIYLVDRWRKRAPAVTPASNDQLSHFRSLYERGEMSPEEFERVKQLLAGQLRKDMNVPTPQVPVADLDLSAPDVESPARDAAIQGNPPPPQSSTPPEEPKS